MEMLIKQANLLFDQQAGSWHKKLLGVITIWQRNSQTRRHLKNLPDYMLKDIGLTRSDVANECAKPFYL
jgi:uncharacterized protein YjiS (DUF1127 family)